MLGTSGFTDDVTFAHNVRAYIATTKGRALKVTPEVAAPGAESAVSVENRSSTTSKRST